VQNLLARGNGKLGEGIHNWSIPPGELTCPGRTTICEQVCYAKQGHFRFEQVKDRLLWNWAQAQRADFVDRMSVEIKRRGCLVIRVHVAGDFWSAEYAKKWLAIMKRCPRPRYYWYSRSWRIAEVAPVLEEMALLKCCRAWYSLDVETGMPERVPVGVKLAYLQTAEDEKPELVDLFFRVRRLRKQRISLPLACPHEADKLENCGSCGRCFR
jgi:hypothetical protein